MVGRVPIAMLTTKNEEAPIEAVGVKSGRTQAMVARIVVSL